MKIIGYGENNSEVIMFLHGSALSWLHYRDEANLLKDYGLIKKKWFAEIQFKSLKIQEKLFEDYYRDTCKIRKQDMIHFLKANSSYIMKSELASTTAKVIILVVGKERKIMQLFSEILHNTIPNSKLKIFKQYFHGELSLNYPNDYSALITHLLLDKLAFFVFDYFMV